MNMVLFVVVAHLLLLGAIGLSVYTFTFGGVSMVDLLLGNIRFFEIPTALASFVLALVALGCCILVEIMRVSPCKL